LFRAAVSDDQTLMGVGPGCGPGQLQKQQLAQLPAGRCKAEQPVIPAVTSPKPSLATHAWSTTGKALWCFMYAVVALHRSGLARALSMTGQ